MTALVVLAILVLAGVAVAGAVRRERHRQAAEEQALVRNGFSRCEDRTQALETVVRSLRNSPRFDVHRPWKRGTGDAAVHWYQVESQSADSEQRVVEDEFLCHLRRPSDGPLILFLSPANLGKGLGAQLIENLLAVTAPRGFHKLDTAASVHASNILAAFGPPNAILEDLVAPEQWSLIADGARHGVFAVRCHGEHCSLELFGAYARKAMKPIAWEDTWSYVRRVADSSLPDAPAPRDSRGTPEAARR